MRRLVSSLVGLVALTGFAHAADFVDVTRPMPRPISAPPAYVRENVRPLIELSMFWSQVRRSQSPEEAMMRLDASRMSLPVVFQGINTDTGVLQRVTILRAYRRVEDEKVELPALTFDTITDGVPRAITMPLWPITEPFYR